MEADFERDFPTFSGNHQQNPLNHGRYMLDWSFIEQNGFKLLNFVDKNHYTCEFEKVW